MRIMPHYKIGHLARLNNEKIEKWLQSERVSEPRLFAQSRKLPKLMHPSSRYDTWMGNSLHHLGAEDAKGEMV